MRLRSTQTAIEFYDNSSAPNPTRDWTLRANDPSAPGIEKFAIEDNDAGTTPVTIAGAAPDNAFWLASSGQLGLGTSLPQSDLHIVDGATPAIRLEQDGSQGQTPQQWVLQGDHGGFELYNPAAGVSPIYVETGANGYSLVVDDAGQVGAGAFTRTAALHVLRSNGTAKLYVQKNSAVVSPRTLLDLRNFGRPEIAMANNATGGEWSFGAGTNFILKQGAVGTASSAKTKLFEIQPSGNAILTGSLTTGGTTCGGGCDLVFSDDYDLPSIETHASEMFSRGYLPNLGPTIEGEPINVTDKLGGVINELEHAHIYIAKQEERIAQLEKMVAKLVEDRSEKAD